MGYPERRRFMPLRMLAGRPRHFQVLFLSLVVLTVGVATALGRPASPTKVETAAALSAGDQFNDVPPSPSPLAADPPSTAPAAPAPAGPAATATSAPDRAAEAAAPPATAPAAPLPTAPPAPAPAAASKPIIPLGKGMWLY